MRIARVVSGGQTGVDRAALEAALAAGIPYGGWCPAGGWAEDLAEPPGLLAVYPALRETREAEPAVRTERNVRDSDAVLVLVTEHHHRSPGTDLTVSWCRRLDRPHLVADVTDTDGVRRWVGSLPTGAVLAVAGPRESESPGIQAAAGVLLRAVLGDRTTRPRT